MSLVYIIFFVTILGTCMATNRSIWPPVDNLFGDNRSRKIYVFLMCALFVILFGCRLGFVDTATYKMMLQRIGTDYANAFNTDSSDIEVGFNLFLVFCNRVAETEQFFVFLSTAISFFGVFYFIYKKSENKAFSIFLFIVLCSFTYVNGIRQAMVTSVFVLLYDVWGKNNIKLIIICLLLSTFHESALFLIPIFMCVKGKALNWKMKLAILFSIICIIYPENIQKIIDVFGNERYSSSLSMFTDGASIERVLVGCMPMLLLVIYICMTKKQGDKITDEDSYIINVLIFNMIIEVGSLRSTYVARLNIYLLPFIIIIIPYLIRKIFKERSYSLACLIVIILYSIYYLYQAYVFDAYGYLQVFRLFFVGE